MEYQSAFERAQQRVRQRQEKRSSFLLWTTAFLVLLVLFISINFIGNTVGMCLFPSLLVTALMVFGSGWAYYYGSINIQKEQFECEKEMYWLFGEDWYETSSPEKYNFAEDRVNKRNRNQELFLLHVLVFLPVNGIVMVLSDTLDRLGQNDPFAILFNNFGIFALLWFILLLYHGTNAFPKGNILKERERKIGQAIEREMELLSTSKLKNEEKQKSDTHYRVGDDGELEEVEDEVVGSDEKSKRIMDEVDNPYNEMGGGKY